MTETEVFAARGVSKAFRGAAVLDGLDLELAPGAVTVVLGENGAGKTTLLRLALGLLAADRGALRVLGADPLRAPAAVRARIGFVPDVPDAPPWMTLGDLERFLAVQVPRWDRPLLRELAGRLAVPAGVPLGRMSRGQGMKAMLVSSLAQRPDLLLLDEPFAGLDPLVRDDVLQGVLGALRDERCTVLCATHDLECAARIADRVAILAGGRIARHGTLEEVLGAGDGARIPSGMRDALAEAVATVAQGA